MKHISLMIGLIMLAGTSYAMGCAEDAYSKACNSCSFDKDGKIDQSCSSGYQSSGKTCVSTSYPIMAAKYAEGKCPDVDSCADELRSCTAQYSTGNDNADCLEGSVAVCYSAADACVRSAASKCGEIQNPCLGSTATFMLLFGGMAFLRIRKG
ncbi:MAG: hypothetical protein U0R44_05080 [Candidatus Micrarchaeia archaeon]